MKIFITGAIFGVDYLIASKKFSKAQNELELLGYKVQNPFELIKRIKIDKECRNEKITRNEIMAIRMRALLKCNAILILPCYKINKIAELERNTADIIGLKIYTCTDDIPKLN